MQNIYKKRGKAPLNISLLSHMLADNEIHIQLIWHIMRGIPLNYMIAMYKRMNTNHKTSGLLLVRLYSVITTITATHITHPLPLERD